MRGVRGPLAGSYPAAAILVVFALIPYLALTASFPPLEAVLSHSLHLSRQSLQLTSGMSNAAYAVGTVLAVQFAQHLRQRRMLLLYSSLFVVAAVLTALANASGPFIAGYVLMGLCTSLMLIAAVPPLVTSFPASKMPWTGAIMNLCIFGAVAAGPLIGGLQASAGAWRPLFWVVAGAGLIAWLFVLLTFEDAEPQDRSAPWDAVALLLGGVGCSAAFFGASELQDHPFTSLIAFAPLVGGLLVIGALVIHQYRARNPLMPVRQFATTKPVAGIVIALAAGAASVGAIGLIETALQTRTSPGHAGVLFIPQLGGALLTAVAFGLLFRSRWMPLLPLAGMAMLVGGTGVVTGLVGGPQLLVLVGSGLLGLGVGSSVSPALFVAGFSLASGQLQRVFALIELLRAVAAFMAAPVVLHVAMTTGGGPEKSGLRNGIWICLGIAAAGGLAASGVWILGRARFQKPDLERWDGGEAPAWTSPPLLGIRRPHTPSGERPGAAPANPAASAGQTIS